MNAYIVGRQLDRSGVMAAGLVDAGAHDPRAHTAAALFDDEFLQRSYALNRDGMQQLCDGFRRLGLDWIPSAGNFVTFKVGDGAGVNLRLLRQGVIVRPIGGYGMPEWLRVSIGLEAENARFLEVLPDCLV